MAVTPGERTPDTAMPTTRRRCMGERRAVAMVVLWVVTLIFSHVYMCSTFNNQQSNSIQSGRQHGAAPVSPEELVPVCRPRPGSATRNFYLAPLLGPTPEGDDPPHRTQQEIPVLRPLHDLHDLQHPIVSPPSWAPGVPLIVHAVWCGPGQLTFRHFLTLATALRLYKPDALHFHYTEYPSVDRHQYNTWLEELRDQFPFFRMHPVLGVCEARGAARPYPSLSDVASLLHETHGGLFISFDIISVNISRALESRGRLVWAPDDTVADKVDLLVIAGGQRFYEKGKSSADYIAMLKSSGEKINCVSPDVFRTSPVYSRLPCIVAKDLQIFPKDLLTLHDEKSDNLKKHFRFQMYGRLRVPQPEQRRVSVIPRLVHYVWFGDCDVTFVWYLSVLSALHIAHVHHVYLHVDRSPRGRYWSLLAANPNVTWIYRYKQVTVYDKYVRHIEHVADIARQDIIVKYGGIMIDPNAVFLKPLSDDLFRYDAVASMDSQRFLMKPFPDVLSLGTMMGRPGAQFWRLYRDSQRYFIDEDYVWNSGRVPYKLYERNPGLLRIEPRLQLVCYDLMCGDELINGYSVIHWTKRVPPELTSLEALQEALKGPRNHTVFGFIGENILKAARSLS